LAIKNPAYRGKSSWLLKFNCQSNWQCSNYI